MAEVARARDRRSFDLKLDRAERHLAELTEIIDVYSTSQPYQVRSTWDTGTRKRVMRLYFTSQPPLEVAVVLGDLVYNLRSALDHLACALVPPKRRNSVMFPIFFQGVWEPPIDGEADERVKQRERWSSCTKGMRSEAIDLLKRMQPADDTSLDGARIVNALYNRDKHRALAVVAHMLVNITGEVLVDDEWRPIRGMLAADEGLSDQAPIQTPEFVHGMRLRGTTRVVVDIGLGDGGLWLPGPFPNAIGSVRRIVDELRPHLHGVA